MFGKKTVSDSMLDAVMGVVSGIQEDATGTQLEAGDAVVVIEGDHDGMTGTIVEFASTGRAVVQLDKGRRVTISNREMVSEQVADAILEGKKLDAVGQEDADIDNDGDSDESDEYLMKRRKAIKKAMKNEGDCGSSSKKKSYKEEVEQTDEGIVGKAARAVGNAVDRKIVKHHDTKTKEARKKSFKKEMDKQNDWARWEKSDGLEPKSVGDRIKNAARVARIDNKRNPKAVDASKRILARRIRQGAEDRRKDSNTNKTKPQSKVSKVGEVLFGKKVDRGGY